MSFISILGFDRSGTTFIGNYLSLYAENSFYAGEIDKGIEMYFKGDIKICSCGLNYLECPVWGEIFPKMIDKNDVGFVIEKIKEITGAQTIIDSSKQKKYIDSFKNITGDDYSAIHIIRNPKAVALSRTKNRKRRVKNDTHPNPKVANKYNLMMLYDSLEWSKDNIWYENFLKKVSHDRLIYERLGSETPNDLKNFLIKNNIPAGKNSIESHMVWGSKNTRTNFDPNIKINNNWRKELNGFNKFLIDGLTFPVRSIMKYKFR